MSALGLYVRTGLKEEAFMKRRGLYLVVAMLACLLASTHAFAQGGGASTTGSINGKVADTSGGVLPGVTVTVAVPADGEKTEEPPNEAVIVLMPAVS